MGIQGTLPSPWFMPNLSELALEENSFSGRLPDLCSLSSLRTLRLRNSFSGAGTLPACMARLTALRDVVLQGLGLTGTLHTSWSKLSMLTELVLHENSLTGSIPQDWRFMGNGSSIGQLNTFDASYNKLTGPLPSFLANIPQLTLGPGNNFTAPLTLPAWMLAAKVNVPINTDSTQNGVPNSGTNVPQKGGSPVAAIVVFTALGIGVVLIGVCIGAYWCFKSKRRNNTPPVMVQASDIPVVVGEPITEVRLTMSCPSEGCGTQLSVGTRFCPQCGRPNVASGSPT
eukprot:NODE_422_length_962_cov_443.189485_g328_i0.p1 GENE.NODE_422_length_962_cov_443.189485_g328_i0~~NODE_422_length_962_cov_443.189485_g328_i0.p1  ORF type:complete len:285 (-),score=36.80 NODE_422_length_962_cov_443.189485_g328_i0:78-932(-)